MALALDPGALPSGGQIAAGSAIISQSGNAMLVNQQTDRMIANWDTFNIGRDASVRFNQPGVSSVALNRISDQNPSQILGSLSANGRIFLLNPSGIVFGQSARVDVGALVASSLEMADVDFLAGRYQFDGDGGAILNQGRIATAEGGVVAFVGGQVGNEGTIGTPGGSTALIAGDEVTLDFTGDGLINYSVDRGDLNVSDAAGSFADKNAANGKAVTVSGLALTGADSGNMRFAMGPNTGGGIFQGTYMGGLIIDRTGYQTENDQ